MINSFSLPLAAGVQELIALVFVLVSVIGWIIRQVQGNNQQMPPPVQRPGRRREERVNDELDSFLQQVSRKGEPNNSPEPARQVAANRPKQQGNRPQGNQRPGTQPKPPVPEPAKPSRRIREENVARPGNGGSNMGSGLSQHVRETMGERIAKEAERDIGRDVTASVNQHMGNFLGQAMSASTSPARVTTKELFAGSAAPASGECCGRAENLKRMLRNPESIRQAIIIQEILNRPKCLR